jgi:hypothetical protein
MLLKSQQDGEFAASEFGHVMTRYRRVTHDTMRPTLDSFRLLLISLAGWLNQQQQEVIDFFTIEAWTHKGLTRFLVLFLITCRVGRWRLRELPGRRMGSG